MESRSIPKISASLSIDPATHSFANSQAPNLNLTITSQHTDPITIYADNPSPKTILTCAALTMTDLTTGSEVHQEKRTHCRIPPPTRIAVPLIERLFHTLLPNVPLTLSAPFTRDRTRTGGKPLAKHDPDYGGNRQRSCGVDGLERGHRYAVSLASKPRVQWYVIRWWEYGTKEEVLRGDGEGGSLDGRQVRYGRGPHESIVMDLTNIAVIEFECQE